MKKPQAPPVPNTSGSGGGGGSNTAGGSTGGGEVNYHPLGAAVSAAPPPLAPSSLTGHQPARSQEGAGPGRKTLSNLEVFTHTETKNSSNSEKMGGIPLLRYCRILCYFES